MFKSRINGWDDIYIMDSNGESKINLTNLGCTGFPLFSPQGDKIIFTAQLSPDFELYSMDIDGQNLTNISNQPGEEADAQFSPDGSQIVYINFHGEGNDPVYIMNSDGSNKQLLSEGGSNRFPRNAL